MPLSHCKNFLRAIQNFHHQDILDPERHGSDVDPKSLGRATEEGLLFKPSEIEFITRQYRFLYSNRQDKIAVDKKESHRKRAVMKQKVGEDFQFKPYTSERTSKLAMQKRAGTQMGVQERIEDRLLISKQESLHRKSQLQEIEFVRRQKETPFRPQISPHTNRHGPLTARHREKQSLFENQWKFLHSQNIKSQQYARMKTQDEVEYERDEKEYTFQPNSSKSPSRLPRHPRQIQINMNIGSEKKVIITDTNADPHKAASAFMRENGIEKKYLQTISDLIHEQQQNVLAGRVSS